MPVLLDFEMHKPGQRRWLIGQENNFTSLRKWQPGLNRFGVESHLPQNLPVRFILRVEERSLREKPRAPTERQEATLTRLANLTESRSQVIQIQFQDR